MDKRKKPSLVLSCPNLYFILDTEASKFAIGAVLSQKDGNGTEKDIHFVSNSLSKAEQNYEKGASGRCCENGLQKLGLEYVMEKSVVIPIFSCLLYTSPSPRD